MEEVRTGDSEEDSEPMNWKEFPSAFLDFIWNSDEDEKNSTNFMYDMSQYTERPISDDIQATIELYCRGIDQDEPFDITERSLCVLSKANIRPMQLTRENLGPENDEKVSMIYAAYKRYAETVWTWGGG